MGDLGCDSLAEEYDPLVTAARKILEALETNANLSDSAMEIMSELSSKLSAFFSAEKGGIKVDEIQELLNSMRDRLSNWETNRIPTREESSKFIEDVGELLDVISCLECENSGENSRHVLLQTARDVLDLSMEFTEEEFMQILVENKRPFGASNNGSFRSIEDEGTSPEEDSVEGSSRSGSMRRSSDETTIDLINPDSVSELRTIADLMRRSNYGDECAQAFAAVRMDAMEECLESTLGMEKLSIEDVLKMNWKSLSSKMRRWVRAMRVFVRVYLTSERRLGERIFTGPASSTVFLESSKSSMLLFLNFADAVTVSPYRPEKLLNILSMHEALTELMPEIEAMFDRPGDWRDVLNNLGNSVKATVAEFETAVASSSSAHPFAGGGIHHLTKYVMNYVTNLTDYSDTLNFLLSDGGCGGEEEGKTSSSSAPVVAHLRRLITVLESNLEEKVTLYRDPALQQFFLMNNVHYMAQKVKSSDLRSVFGDEWIKQRNRKFQQHAMKYEKETWSSVVGVLRDDGIENPGSSSAARGVLREKVHEFNVRFEEVYRNQTGWVIPDLQLREDLRISASLKVVQAYRTFIGRHSGYISDRHVKFSADDLQAFILDLFDGSHRSLPSSHRR